MGGPILEKPTGSKPQVARYLKQVSRRIGVFLSDPKIGGFLAVFLTSLNKNPPNKRRLPQKRTPATGTKLREFGPLSQGRRTRASVYPVDPHLLRWGKLAFSKNPFRKPYKTLREKPLGEVTGQLDLLALPKTKVLPWEQQVVSTAQYEGVL